jgi:hypothetical protein
MRCNKLIAVILTYIDLVVLGRESNLVYGTIVHCKTQVEVIDMKKRNVRPLAKEIEHQLSHGETEDVGRGV